MLTRALLLSLCLCAASSAQIPDNPDWRREFPPFQLIGNVYWVGTYDLSTYLITTDAGHVLINTGFTETLPRDAIVVDEGLVSTYSLPKFLPLRGPNDYYGLASGGLGFAVPGAVGISMALPGRPVAAIVGDGSAMYGIQGLWTAAHHKIPLLLIVHNNRAYHAEVMLVQRTAARRGRGNDMVDIGNVIRDPAPDYAKIAQGYGLHAEGPVADPAALAPALERALARVRAGEPALIDVISQPR